MDNKNIVSNIANAVRAIIDKRGETPVVGVLWGYLLALYDANIITEEDRNRWTVLLDTAITLFKCEEIDTDSISEILKCEKAVDVIVLWGKKRGFTGNKQKEESNERY